MKSSTGKYYLGLDHIRGIAAFFVFTWHFIHINGAHKTGPVAFPFNVLTEGHTGVALFMVLSGYLFAKLLDNKKVIYPKFIFNRIIRLLPLLFVVLSIVGLIEISNGASFTEYIKSILAGIYKPSLPNGGWSITVEFHFYLLLPILLFFNRKWRHALSLMLIISILLRLILYFKLEQIQDLSYWTIVGRVDQFLLGILAFNLRMYIMDKNVVALFAIFLFCSFYYYFDFKGGFYSFTNYPSPSPLWIILPTIEGFFYAFLVSWYDNSFSHSESRLSRLIASAGKYSYSIYLLHFFIVFRIASFINYNVLDLSNIYIAILVSIPCFILMIPIGYLSFRFIELPFMKFRTTYLEERKIKK